VRLLHQQFCAKKLQSQNITREKLLKALLYKKFARKILMKLTSCKKDPYRNKRLISYPQMTKIDKSQRYCEKIIDTFFKRIDF
jgi:hypothetical protein